MAVSTALVLAGIIAGYVTGSGAAKRNILEPQEEVSIVEADLRFRARLDTGAVVSSINAHDIHVIGGGARPSRDDVGKMVSFVLINDAGQRQALTAQIEQVRGIRAADCREVRYHVYLTVEFGGAKRRILTNLNDRSGAGEKLLLGRNWLRFGYAVAPVKEVEI